MKNSFCEVVNDIRRMCYDFRGRGCTNESGERCMFRNPDDSDDYSCLVGDMITCSGGGYVDERKIEYDVLEWHKAHPKPWQTSCED